MATPGRGKSRGGRELERSPVSQLKRPPEEDDLEATALELANLLLAWPCINFIFQQQNNTHIARISSRRNSQKNHSMNKRCTREKTTHILRTSELIS